MKTYKEFSKHLTEAKLSSKWDNQYKKLIKKTRSLNWPSPPKKMVQSAGHYLMNVAPGVPRLEFTWHQPDTKWGAHWAFVSATYFPNWPSSNGSIEVEGAHWEDLIDKPNDDFQRDNIKSWEDAINKFQKILKK